MSEWRFSVHEPIRQAIMAAKAAIDAGATVTHAEGVDPAELAALQVHRHGDLVACARRSVEVYRQMAPRMPGVPVGAADLRAHAERRRRLASGHSAMPGIQIGSGAGAVHAHTGQPQRAPSGHYRMPGIRFD